MKALATGGRIRVLMALVMVPATMFLGACATTPLPLRVSAPLSPTIPREAQVAGHVGEQVRWGGTIIQTNAGSDQTCFEVLGLELANNGEPKLEEIAVGRFIGCIPGFYEPLQYAPGRSITLIGRITETETRNVGDYPYIYPRMSSDRIYLWPKRRELPYAPYGDPFFYPPYWPTYPWWW